MPLKTKIVYDGAFTRSMAAAGSAALAGFTVDETLTDGANSMKLVLSIYRAMVAAAPDDMTEGDAGQMLQFAQPEPAAH
jgi:hypothetical protein